MEPSLLDEGQPELRQPSDERLHEETAAGWPAETRRLARHNCRRAVIPRELRPVQQEATRTGQPRQGQWARHGAHDARRPGFVHPGRPLLRSIRPVFQEIRTGLPRAGHRHLHGHAPERVQLCPELSFMHLDRAGYHQFPPPSRSSHGRGRRRGVFRNDGTRQQGLGGYGPHRSADWQEDQRCSLPVGGQGRTAPHP